MSHPNNSKNTKEISRLSKKLLPVIRQINIEINKTANKNRDVDSIHGIIRKPPFG